MCTSGDGRMGQPPAHRPTAYATRPFAAVPSVGVRESVGPWVSSVVQTDSHWPMAGCSMPGSQSRRDDNSSDPR